MSIIGKLDEVTLEKFFEFFEDYTYKPAMTTPRKKGEQPQQKMEHGEPVMEIDWNQQKAVPEETRKKLQSFLDRGDVDGFVVFEVLDMSSSQLGSKTAVPFGPGCSTLKTAEAALGQHLGDVPSRFQYPQYVYRKPRTGDNAAVA